MRRSRSRRADAPVERARARSVAHGRALTVLAVALVWFGADRARPARDLTPAAFVRSRWRRSSLLALLRRWCCRRGPRPVAVAVSGSLLGLLTVVKVLDMGFFAALDRPFDSVVDWRYLGSAVGLVDDSARRPAAVGGRSLVVVARRAGAAGR